MTRKQRKERIKEQNRTKSKSGGSSKGAWREAIITAETPRTLEHFPETRITQVARSYF